jgi:hypothetical protein
MALARLRLGSPRVLSLLAKPTLTFGMVHEPESLKHTRYGISRTVPSLHTARVSYKNSKQQLGSVGYERVRIFQKAARPASHPSHASAHPFNHHDLGYLLVGIRHLGGRLDA